MSEQDQQTRNDAALGKVVRLKHDMAHAEAALTDVASQMEDCAKLIRNGRRDFVGDWLNKDVFSAIWADIDRAKQEVRDAEKVATGFGVVVPY
jgi:hypothetical protein